MGAIIHDHMGGFIVADTQDCVLSLAVEVEASTAILGISLAPSLNLPNVVFETDCHDLFLALMAVMRGVIGSYIFFWMTTRLSFQSILVELDSL